jgi:hypothetical protein
MLVTNQRLDKLAATQVDFTSHGMLNGTCLSAALKALCKFLAFSAIRKSIFNPASATG